MNSAQTLLSMDIDETRSSQETIPFGEAGDTAVFRTVPEVPRILGTAEPNVADAGRPGRDPTLGTLYIPNPGR